MNDFQMPVSERALIPSVTQVTKPDDGVASRLSQTSDSKPTYNGMKIQDVASSELSSSWDKLDKVAIAQREYNTAVGKYRGSEFHKNFAKLTQQSRQRSIKK